MVGSAPAPTRSVEAGHRREAGADVCGRVGGVALQDRGRVSGRTLVHACARLSTLVHACSRLLTITNVGSSVCLLLLKSTLQPAKFCTFQ